jgi:Family of unknown function (DUF5681)
MSDTSQEIAVTKQFGHRFQPGQSGNPKGKPKGTRSRANQLMDRLFSKNPEDLQTIVDNTIKLAKMGEPWAVESILRRMWIPARERMVTFPMVSIKTQADVAAALDRILEVTSQGLITPGEATALAAVIEKLGKSLELSEMDRRLTALEGRVRR